MELPPGFSDPKKPSANDRNLDGLKQAPTFEFDRFSTAVEKMGLKRSLNDYSLFVKQSASGLAVICFYLYFIVIT